MKNFIRFFITLSVLFVSLGFPNQVTSQTEAIVFADPAGFPLSVGETQQIAIKIQNVTDLWAFDLEVHFDQDTLSVTNVQLGDFLDPGFQIGPTIENGTIHFANAQISTSEPKTGSGDLMVITVQALENIDEVHLNITDVLLSDRNGQVIPCRVINSGLVSLYLPLVLR